MPKSRQRSPKAEPLDEGWHRAEAPPVHTAPTMPLRLPDFWEERPRQWFLHVEAVFKLRRISNDDDMFNHVVSALTSNATTRLTGLLTRPPSHDKYATIKSRLLRAFVPAETERANRLFAISGLGSRTPSELKEYIDELAGEDGPEFIFKHFFLRQLPASVRAALANTPDDDFDAFVEEADRVYLATLGADNNPRLPAFTSPAHQGKKRATAAKPHSSAAGAQGSTGECYYHATYGPQARRCRAPCTYQDQGNAKAGVRSNP